MITRIESITALLKANTGAATVSPTTIDTYASYSSSITLETISSLIMATSPLKAAFQGLPTTDLVEQMFMSVFGYTTAQIDALKATQAGAAGFQYWENELTNNSSMININTLAIALINGAPETEQAKVVALVAAEVDAYEAAYPDGAVEPEVEGQTFELTSGTDKGAAFVGTTDSDTFDASIAQNSFTGGISNTLSSADKLDGGAGTDTLHAELVAEFVGATSGDYQIDVQPQTKDIENVTFEARDAGSNDGDNANTLVTVDAKYMYGVNEIGSKFSDGDLKIENLTTLADDATTIRNTADMTITMDHTDDTNSDGDASDLTVLFDEDYLVTGQQTSDATLTIRLLNAVQNEAGNNPIEGFSSITFTVGTKEITVDITSVANDATQDYTTAYDAIVDLINAELIEQDITTVEASTTVLANAVFSIPVSGFDVGDSAGQYYPITLTNSGSEALAGVEIESSKLSYDTDMNGSFTKTAPVTEQVPLSVKIELEKVGRDGEGGNLVVGAKGLDSSDAGNTDVDTTDGINVFNITVKGDEDLPSNLGVIQSTNDHLETVNIVSETRTDGSYAALTVRGQTAGDDVFNSDDSRPFGGTLELLDADGFKGDLSIGEVTQAFNIDTFTAMGGGDVYLKELIAKESDGSGSFASLDANEFTIDTGAGTDTIIVNANSGAQVDINTSAGNDAITVYINDQDDSGSDKTFATITSTSGNNTVKVYSNDALHEATINLGSGADIVEGNSVNITADTGSGDDVIYAENTGAKVVAALAAGTYGGFAHADTGVITDAQLLNGRTVQITVAMPEETTNTPAEAVDFVNGYELEAFTFESDEVLSTELEFYTAVANAINSDDKINKLVAASIDSHGNLFVTYKIDGAVVAGEKLVEINISEEYTSSAQISTELLTAIKIANADSTITAADVFTGYQATTTNIEDTYVYVGTPAKVSFDVSTLTDNEDITISIDGYTAVITGATNVEADAVAEGSITVNGIEYAITSTGANNVTITQKSGLPADLNTVTIIDETLVAAVAGTITDGTGLTLGLGSDSTKAANNSVNGGTDDDIIVLSSNDDATDTVVFDTSDIGNDIIIHFEQGATGDKLDFSAYLNGQISSSGSTESRTDIVQTLVTNITNIVADSVVVTDFNDVQTGYGSGDVTFANLTSAQLTAALNGTATAGIATTFTHDLTSDLVGTTGKAILLIQNDDDGDGVVDAGDNFGEYIVAEITFNDDGTTDNVQTGFNATIIGTLDFGEAQTFNAANIA